jgi:hypothetical protein
MSRPKIIIHNAATGEAVEREMNDEEFAQYELDQIAKQERKEAEEAKLARQQAARESALAKLAALGLNEEETTIIIK